MSSNTVENPANADHVLSVRNLVHRFGAREVLKDLSFDVRRGEIFGLLGPNGSGKSTALSVIAGTLARQNGEILLDGIPLKKNDRRLRERIGVVFQSPSLDAKLTGLENLRLAAYIQGLSRPETIARAARQIERAELSERMNEAVEKYSGGMKRRLDIARALIHKPNLLLMDEPTAGLDEAAFRATWQRLEAMREGTDLTIILSTHRPDEAAKCDRLAIITDGRIGIIDTPQSLRQRISHDVVVLRGENLDGLCLDLMKRFGVHCLIDDGAILIETERGHELVPRLVEAYPPGRFASVSLRQPSLADVFLKITGRALDEDLSAKGVS